MRYLINHQIACWCIFYVYVWYVISARLSLCYVESSVCVMCSFCSMICIGLSVCVTCSFSKYKSLGARGPKIRPCLASYKASRGVGPVDRTLQGADEDLAHLGLAH